MPIFTGSGTAVVTPFGADGKFNYGAYEKLIEFQIANGADAIITCGTTGEASTLSLMEHVEVVGAAAAITNGRVPVIAGAGGNDTNDCIELGKACTDVGANALMYVTPYYNKPSQRGIIAHYTALDKAVNAPIVMYNIPGRCVTNMTSKTIAEIAQLPNVVAIKEASGDFGQVAEIAELCDITIYSGNDDYILPILSLGGKGVISTTGNIAPKTMHDMVTKYLAGDTAEALKLQLSILGLMRQLFADGNPVGVKAALNLMGFGMGDCRLPLATAEESHVNALAAEMKKFGLLA
ncbi:MAG: 4-hydroxy-tetrahydrodipicolinate synthase [Defluviitaleaceae bacterium]|nr:4-hydroxy-tetrahydrodipicolinate synthase [Defluviitaleaceae bacterium]